MSRDCRLIRQIIKFRQQHGKRNIIVYIALFFIYAIYYIKIQCILIVISWCTNPGVTIGEIILNGCRAAASATTDDAIQVVPLPVRLRQFIARSKVVHRPGCRKRRISTLSLGVNFLRPEHHLFLHSWRDNYSKLIVVWLTGPDNTNSITSSQ